MHRLWPVLALIPILLSIAPSPPPQDNTPLGTPTMTPAPAPVIRAFSAVWEGTQQARITWDTDAVFGCIGRYRGAEWTYLGCDHSTIVDTAPVAGDEYVLLVQGVVAGRASLRGVVWLPAAIRQ